MAILMRAVVPGVTTAQYDELNAELRALPGDIFAGCLAHACVSTDTGIEVYDLWESKEAMEAFFASMMPVAQGLKWPAAPESPEVREVYQHWVPGV